MSEEVSVGDRRMQSLTSMTSLTTIYIFNIRINIYSFSHPVAYHTLFLTLFISIRHGSCSLTTSVLDSQGFRDQRSHLNIKPLSEN
jgi:hypothetical protein